jgi:hypothetical protein
VIYRGVDDFELLHYSQAAIQASKERAGEVTLKHFEWAKVYSVTVEVVSLSSDLPRIVF